MPGSAGPQPRVLVVTAGMGAGHSQIAAELARRLAVGGACTEVLDVLAAAGRAGARLQATYRFLLDHAPWLYDAAMRVWARRPALLEAVTALGGGPFDRALHAAVDRFVPDVIVSTYNLASLRLGRLAERGLIRAPLCTLVTDPGAHPYWISGGVQHHFAITPLTAERLVELGARGVEVVAPVLRPQFADPPDRTSARRRLELPVDTRVVLINAGSWAVGGIDATLDVLCGDGALCVLVLCGRDERLAARVRARRDPARVVAVGWTDDVVSYLAAADAVVDNAGGLTCLESLACGVPVVIFRPLPGHGRINAMALERSGLARYVRAPGDLLPALSGGRTATTWTGADLAARVLALTGSPSLAGEA